MSINPLPLHLSLPPEALSSLAKSWLQEDCPAFDAAATIATDTPRQATLYAKSRLVLAGTAFFDAVFAQLSCRVTWYHEESSLHTQRTRLATVSGPAHLLLHGERVALNAIAECSAVATAAHDAMQIARKGGWKGCLAATRKTAPGLRLVQKYGILVGGMDTHRMDLSAMVMIKDNHIMAAGGIDKAVRDVHRVAGFSCKIDVECSNVGDALEACQAGADIVMLDNFEASIVEEAAAEIKKKWPNVLVEVSGGITAETLPKFTSPLVDVISFSINRYARPVDMSLKIDP